MDITTEKAALCALNRIFGFEPKTGIALLTGLGSAEAAFSLTSKDLDLLLGPHRRQRADLKWSSVENALKELEALARKGIRFTGWSEEGYPALLKDCDDAPVGLYIRSSTPDNELWGKRRMVSIVGTRDLSPYGREWCGRIVRNLASSAEKPTIVSGLAIGTDICAHRNAIESGLPTIGVMATGPDTVYPLRHMDFAEKMCRIPGCALVTDYPPGTPPLAIHFLRRNRIIAGLGEATLLIESKAKGGGMMTSNLAFSYGRDVYAVPGRIDDICSQGCNILIRNKMAEPITGEADLAESLGMKTADKAEQVSDKEILAGLYGGTRNSDRIETLSRILTTIRKRRGITVEELAEANGLAYSDTVRMTGLLESDGLITIDLLQRCCINVPK